MINELPTTLVCIVVGLVLLFPRIMSFSSDWDRRLMVAMYFAHVVSAFLQAFLVYVFYRGEGDGVMYLREGEFFARLLNIDILRFGPEIVRLLLQLDARLPLPFIAQGNPTTTMSCITGILLYVAPGDLTTMGVLFGMWAFLGMSGLYTVFRESLPGLSQKKAFLAAHGVPSVVFWSSTISKEAIALGGVGFAVYGLHRALRGSWLVGVSAIGVGLSAVLVVKPYILMPFGAGTAAFIALHRFRTQNPGQTLVLKPLQVLVGSALAIGFVLAVGEVAPRFSLSGLGDEVARRQHQSLAFGGSAYQVGSSEVRTLSGQMAFAPIALVTALLRPFIFEARNILSLINGLETLAVASVLALVMSRRSWKAVFEELLASPLLVFALAFVVMLAIGVGLSTSNFGTLSRYRMPLMPFWALILLVGYQRGVARDATPIAGTVPTPVVSARGA